MGEWRPIETAPKDGTEILVYYSKSRCYELVTWWLYPREDDDRERWVDADYRECAGFDFWCALPPLPEVK